MLVIALFVGSCIGFAIGRRDQIFPLTFKRQVDVTNVFQYLTTLVIAFYLQRFVAERKDIRSANRTRIITLANELRSTAKTLRMFLYAVPGPDLEASKANNLKFLSTLTDGDSALNSLRRTLDFSGISDSAVNEAWRKFRRKISGGAIPYQAPSRTQEDESRQAFESLIEELDFVCVAL
jgi:hypothetical protein